MQSVLDYAKAHRQTFVDQLETLLRIPSVSSDVKNHRQDSEDAAKWLLEDMQRIGLNSVQFLDVIGDYPKIVYGEWLEAGENAATVLIYGHYDVQPAKKSDGWDTEPFVPVIKENGHIYARGASDDKGTDVNTTESGGVMVSQWRLSGECQSDHRGRRRGFFTGII